MNNPEKENKNQKRILNEKESQSPFFNITKSTNVEKDRITSKNITKTSKTSKCSSNSSNSEKDFKIDNRKRLNFRNHGREKESDFRSKSNILHFERNSTAAQTITNVEKNLSFNTHEGNEKANKLNDLKSCSISLRNNNYHKGGTNNLSNILSNRFCFYCFRGEDSINLNSSYSLKNNFECISHNNSPIGFSNYLKYLGQKINRNRKETIISKHHFEPIKNISEDYILNDNYNGNFLDSKNNFLVREIRSKNLNDIGIRDFYNNHQKQNSLLNKSFKHTLSQQTKNKKSENSNNFTLRTNEDKTKNQSNSKDYCISKINICKNLHKSFNSSSQNKKQNNEIFNCESVISFAKINHIHNEFKKNCLCKFFCVKCLDAVHEESQNIAKNYYEHGNKGQNPNNKNNKKEVLLVRDLNTDKNEFLYKRKGMSDVY